MSRSLQTLAVLALLAGVAACQDSGSTTGTSSDLLVADGFETLPLGFADVNSTFGSVSDSGTTGWHPRGPHGRGHRGQGGMMCGGLGGFFGPGLDFGLRHGPFRGQLGATCSFDAGVNRVVCDTVTRGGLSIAQSIAYYDTAGVVQSAYDSLSTNTINVQVSVTGTKVHHGGDTSVVRHASDRTVTGLAPAAPRGRSTAPRAAARPRPAATPWARLRPSAPWATPCRAWCCRPRGAPACTRPRARSSARWT